MNYHRNRILMALFVVAFVTTTSRGQEEEKPLKIGYVRLEKLVHPESAEVLDEVKALRDELQAEIEKRVAQWNAEKQELEKDYQALRSGSGASKWSSAEAQEDKMDALEKRGDELKAKQARIQEYQARAAQKAQMTIFTTIEKGAQALGEKKGLDAVLTQGAAYVSKRMDHTNELRTMLNKEYAEKKSKKADSPEKK